MNNCIFENNSITIVSGGAVVLDTSTINGTITHCIFQNNSANGDGGAVWMRSSSVKISVTSSTFQNNRAYYGGAMCSDSGRGIASQTAYFRTVLYLVELCTQRLISTL